MIRRGWSCRLPIGALVLTALLLALCATAAMAVRGNAGTVSILGLPSVEYHNQESRPYAPDGRAAYVPNEYIVHCQQGTTPTMAKKAVEAMGGTIVRAIALPDTYLVRVGTAPGGGVPRYVISGGNAADYGSRLSALSATQVIDSIQPNLLYRPCVEPNDPLWNRQWDMLQIKMPAAWGIEKGSEGVIVAVIDTGVAYTHPDLINRCVQGVDTFSNNYDPFDYPPGDGVGHGTHVAGIIAAQGDNGEGISGVCWDGVKIMPIRSLGPVDDSHTAGTTETVIAGMEWAMTHGAQVVNMSLGAPARNSDLAYRIKLAQLAQAGVVVCVAAGNTGDTSYPETNSPGLFPEAICVSATNDNEEIAGYSSFGPAYEVDIAAPGGEIYVDQSGVVRGGIWSTVVTWEEQEGGWWSGSYGYAGMDGTSMACPHVAGAAALLLSQGIPASQVRSRLLQSARMPAEPIAFDRRKYGAGILDVQAALSSAGAKILTPAKGATIDPDATFSISLRGLDNSTVKVYVDYATDDGSPLGTLAGETPIISGVNPVMTSLEFKWSDYNGTQLTPGTHYICVIAYPKNGGSAVSDWVMFQVADKRLAGGLRLFSFPFILNTSSVTPSDILPGTDFGIMNPNRSVLHRYVSALTDYTTYVPGTSSDMAWVNPMFGSQPTGGGYYDLVKRDEGGAVVSRLTRQFGFPAGAGFWLIMPNQLYVQVNSSYSTLMNYSTGDGYVFDTMKGFSIPLYKGWNMIGNPYTHPVPWRTVRLTYQGLQKPLQEAAVAGWVQSDIYAYRSTGTPGYDRLTDRDTLEPYSGYWIWAAKGSEDPTESLMLTILP